MRLDLCHSRKTDQRGKGGVFSATTGKLVYPLVEINRIESLLLSHAHIKKEI